jgi:hypothetical protein
VITEVPAHVPVKVTAPVLELIVRPLARLAESRAYVNDVEFEDVAIYVTVPAPWQRDDVAPSVNTGIPTVGVTVTT